MTDNVSTIEDQNNPMISQQLFWITLILGAISGASGYFILRFTQGLTWYVLAPILYTINFICIFLYVHKFQVEKGTNQLLRVILKNTGTWIIIYFVVGTAIFYYGW